MVKGASQRNGWGVPLLRVLSFTFMRPAFCAVALLALAFLLPRAIRVGLAGGYADPVTRIPAQDEAIYAHSAISAAVDGGWRTPRLLNLALNKPPMPVWAAAISARIFGVDRVSLRLPILLTASLAVGLIFLWGAESSGVIAGACAALLLLGNHLFHTMATLAMADAPLLAFTIAAMYCAYADPWLESRAAFFGYSAACAAAILTGGVAGLLPLAILVLHWATVRRQERPVPLRILCAVALALLLAAPWFLYHLAVHTQWFWTGNGVLSPARISSENPVLLYLTRLAATDPVLLSAFAVSLPGFVTILRRRESGPVLLGCWTVLALATADPLPILPPMAIIAGAYSPFSSRQYAHWLLIFLCAGILVKAASPESPWGLSYRAETAPSAPALSKYCAAGGTNELIVIDAADNFYASVLPLHHLSYALVGPQQGINPAASGAALIRVSSEAELADLVRAHPAIDFFSPDRYRDLLANSSHDYVPDANGFFFLRSRLRGPQIAPTRTCKM